VHIIDHTAEEPLGFRSALHHSQQNPSARHPFKSFVPLVIASGIGSPEQKGLHISVPCTFVPVYFRHSVNN